MLPEEQKILTVKYKSQPFAKMDDETLDLWADALLLKIHVITGWAVPEKSVGLVFTDQFKKKMIESYANVNPDEVDYAFRNFGTVVKDWGKSMNLSLIDEVMIPYLAKRFEVSKIEEQQQSRKMIEAPVVEISYDELWDATEALVKKGGYSVDLIPPGLYEWLDGLGSILTTRDEKIEYMERAKLYRHGKLAESYEADPSNRNAKNALTEFNRMREAGKFEGDELETLKNLAKRMVVYDMMKTNVK